ncbi:hypothetical protein ARALYDRAFT_343860 [Arabidopsis lyrata subsp. lyrata]|uniref:Vacuolar protein sorting-associated protein 54 N-terminal domain-containing protein n=1 Tax=Arabidopsis lyrata subsp. lyrata TaxID=81972 RepID=D7LEM9_ARALL|nr:hypothetical protein ARALYDRAFT_343860 [Arabidopsis lyrata subsp. lyrata]
MVPIPLSDDLDAHATVNFSNPFSVSSLITPLELLPLLMRCEMQPNLFPFGSVLSNPFLFNGGDLNELGSGLLPSPSFSDRPEIPARAAAAAAVARALAGLPSDQRLSISSTATELSSIYGNRPLPQQVEELEEEDFDPVRHILENVPDDQSELAYFEKQATLRLLQLDRVAENLSHHVMEHHEVMGKYLELKRLVFFLLRKRMSIENINIHFWPVKGMNLVRELEKDLKIANVSCKNGRRNLTSSMNEASGDLIVHTHSKKKQAFLSTLEDLVEEGKYCKAFQVLSEYLQLLDSLSEFSAAQEMTRSVEVWLGRTLHKLDSLLLGVCQEFKEDRYVMVLDAYALIGDVSGLAEKIQSFFMQEVISETHSVLKTIVGEDIVVHAWMVECIELAGDNSAATQYSRLTYSDLCLQTPESKFRQCLLRTLAVLFQLIYSYHEIMSFTPEKKIESLISPSPATTQKVDLVTGSSCDLLDGGLSSTMSSGSIPPCTISAEESDVSGTSSSVQHVSNIAIDESRNSGDTVSSKILQRGRRNLWQLTTSRVSVLLSSPGASSTSIHQFLKNYEDLSVFILAREAFCGFEVVDFREKLKGVCENYFTAFHRQSMHALKMVLEKERWTKLSPDTVQAINFAGLVGDGAPLIISSCSATGSSRFSHSNKSNNSIDASCNRSGFSYWLKGGNPFSAKLTHYREDQDYSLVNGDISGDYEGNDSIHDDVVNSKIREKKRTNGGSPVSEDEKEDLLADFIDEDSQLPRRSFTRSHSRTSSSYLSTNDDLTAQTGSSLCLLSQENTNSGGKGGADSFNHRLKSSLSGISQECEQWIKPHVSSSPSSSLAFPNTVHSLADVTPASPLNTSGHLSGVSFSLKERCAAVDTVSLVARILHKSKAHLQSMLMSRNGSLVEDFFGLLDMIRSSFIVSLC